MLQAKQVLVLTRTVPAKSTVSKLNSSLSFMIHHLVSFSVDKLGFQLVLCRLMINQPGFSTPTTSDISLGLRGSAISSYPFTISDA